MRKENYNQLCKKIQEEWEVLENPSSKDLFKIALKLKITKEEVRECIGIKDFLDFETDLISKQK